MRNGILIFCCWISTFCAFAQTTTGKYVAFLACPIVRDSKAMPCWLAEKDGTTYYLGQQGSSASAFYPPQLKHQVLVEGFIQDPQKTSCGGIVIDPIVISVMPELDLACTTLLPAEDGLEPPAPVPFPKYEPFSDDTKEFQILYDFDSDYLTLHKTRIAGEAVRVAKIQQPARIEIHAYRGKSKLSDGTILEEKLAMVHRRAEKMFDVFVGLDISKEKIKVFEHEKALGGKGEGDYLNRKLVIKLYK